MFRKGNIYEIREGAIGECVAIDNDGDFWIEIPEKMAKELSIGMFTRSIESGENEYGTTVEEDFKRWGVEINFREGYDYLGDNEFINEYKRVKGTPLARKMYSDRIYKEKDGWLWV